MTILKYDNSANIPICAAQFQTLATCVSEINDSIGVDR